MTLPFLHTQGLRDPWFRIKGLSKDQDQRVEAYLNQRVIPVAYAPREDEFVLIHHPFRPPSKPIYEDCPIEQLIFPIEPRPQGWLTSPWFDQALPGIEGCSRILLDPTGERNRHPEIRKLAFRETCFRTLERLGVVNESCMTEARFFQLLDRVLTQDMRRFRPDPSTMAEGKFLQRSALLEDQDISCEPSWLLRRVLINIGAPFADSPPILSFNWKPAPGISLDTVIGRSADRLFRHPGAVTAWCDSPLIWTAPRPNRERPLDVFHLPRKNSRFLKRTWLSLEDHVLGRLPTTTSLFHDLARHPKTSAELRDHVTRLLESHPGAVDLFPAGVVLPNRNHWQALTLDLVGEPPELKRKQLQLALPTKRVKEHYEMEREWLYRMLLVEHRMIPDHPEIPEHLEGLLDPPSRDQGTVSIADSFVL